MNPLPPSQSPPPPLPQRLGGEAFGGLAGGAPLDAAAALEAAFKLAELASEAGGVVMRLYGRGCGSTLKADATPVTEADLEAEAVIMAGLGRLAPGVEVIAEERCAAQGVPEGAGGRFFLVDPLDGTREFLSRNGEFTINIALIEAGRPRIGVVFAPALGRLYVGAVGAGAFRTEVTAGQAPVRARFEPIFARRPPADGLWALCSRSHLDPETERFFAGLSIAHRRAVGSSLKLCLLAEGAGDVYPRFGPTMEWDIAAGHGVLSAAGGRVETPEGGAFVYGKGEEGFRNGPFVAWGLSQTR